MLALVKTAPGTGHLELQEVPDPTPGPGQVLIEVAATGLCGTDLHIYLGEYRCTPPVVLGHEVAGTIAAVGPGVTRLTVGDRVTTETYFATCGRCRYCRSGRPNLCPDRRSIGTHVNGGFARYLVMPEERVHRLPDNVDLIAGALTEPLACCLHNLLDMAGVQPGDVVVISGPGTIGLLCLQVARAAGATTVVLGVDGDETRFALARDLGADYVLNVQCEDAQALVQSLTDGLGADLTVEAAGAGASLRQCLDLVRRGGTVAQIGLYGQPVTVDMNQVAMKELRVVGSFAHVPTAWPRALQLLSRGLVQTRPLVTHQFPLTRWEEAFQTFTSRAAGKIVLVPV